jgi:LacI family transcriptional regulator
MELTQSPERRAGIARFAVEAGWILDSRLDAFLKQGLEREYLTGGAFDGVISMMTKRLPALKDIVLSLNVPVVDIWHDFPEVECPRVLLDQRANGRVGAEHLLDRGLTNLMFYSHDVDRRVAGVRAEGFREAAAARGWAARELSWGSDTPHRPGENRLEWLGRMLVECGVPLGVMAVNDQVASEVVDAAIGAGLRVPEDVAIVGCDNDPILARLGLIPLSSVDSGRERVGYEAAALLNRLLDGAPAPKSPLLVPPAGIVLRQSSDVLAVGDKNVRAAVCFIRDHFHESITVADVAGSTLLSRRRLQDLFVASIGHGINDEILRQRLSRAQQLLTETPHKLDKIARDAGFGDGARLSKVFRRMLGVTPRDYRNSYRSGLNPANEANS